MIPDPPALYPPIDAHSSGMLQVAGGHLLYWEESGNPDGRPVVVLHGGPGFGSTPRMRRFFDPARYRIILFDQRGSGRSAPAASLEQNSTPDLVGDIEALRAERGIDRWLLFGGSWGTTLALAYAQAHPKRVSGLILRGVFLLRECELDWLYRRNDGVAALFPDAWEQFIAPVPTEERRDPVAAYHRRLTGPDAGVAARWARRWTAWEAMLSHLHPPVEAPESLIDPAAALAIARLETHYFVHRGFFRTDGQLLEDIAAMSDIPGVIVQGRYDLICPPRSAWDLACAWPAADLRIVPGAGHSSLEPPIARELVRATDAFADPDVAR